MKRIVILLATLALALSASANERPITFEKLPTKARSFITQHFPNHTLSYAKFDNDITDHTYDVIFTDGTKVEFGRRGEWRKVECRRGGAVPAGVIPESIRDYVEANFPNAVVTEIEHSTRHYEVRITGGLELVFDSAGRIRHYDD